MGRYTPVYRVDVLLILQSSSCQCYVLHFTGNLATDRRKNVCKMIIIMPCYVRVLYFVPLQVTGDLATKMYKRIVTLTVHDSETKGPSERSIDSGYLKRILK